MVVFHLKDSDDREEEKKKKLIGLLLFLWVDFLRGESLKPVLLSIVATWELGVPRSGCRSPAG